MTPRVIGLDLSLTSTGIASLGAVQVVPTRAKDPLGYRLDVIVQAVTALDGDVWVIEDLPTHAHSAGITGKVHGAVRYALWRMAIDENVDVWTVTVPPASLKKYACGKGNANKGEMLAAAIRRLGYEGADDNEADAMWLRAMGMDALGSPIVTVPETHRVALAKVDWPPL